MAFHDVAFPVTLSPFVTGGPRRVIDVVEARSGVEVRNLAAANSRRRYLVRIPAKRIDLVDTLLHFWEGRRNGLFSFPLRDKLDDRTVAPNGTVTATDQTLGTGDGATTDFQLVKVYEPSGPNPYTRKITKPGEASVKVALDDVEQATGWSVARLTGIVTFDVAPGAGVVVKAGCRFEVPVRFVEEDLLAQFVKSDHVEYGETELKEVLSE